MGGHHPHHAPHASRPGMRFKTKVKILAALILVGGFAVQSGAVPPRAELQARAVEAARQAVKDAPGAIANGTGQAVTQMAGMVGGSGALNLKGALAWLASLFTSHQIDRSPRPPGRVTRQPRPSQRAIDDIPPRYLKLYKKGARECPGLSWTVLAGIGKVETNHGRLRLPGVRSGINRYKNKRGQWTGCCAGPMQFNLTDGPPSTWDRHKRRGDSVYDPADAIPAAARKLCSQGAPRNIRGALYGYNHSRVYGNTVLELAAAYKAGR